MLVSSSPKKILIIVENNTVPLDTRVWKESCSLRDAGYLVSVLCPRGDGRYGKKYEVMEGIHIYRHPMPREGNSASEYLREYTCALFWEVLYTWWIYLTQGFDIIQGCNPPDTIFLIAAPFKVLGVKYVFDHHDVIPELYLSKFNKTGWAYKIQLWLEKMTFYFSDVVIATNNSYREVALTRGRIDPADVFIVRNGPDLRTFKEVPPNLKLKRGRQYLVGYVGTMSVQEGLDILLDVARWIKRSGRCDVQFTCVGGGPGLAALRNMAREKEVTDVVHFTGRISDEDLLEVLSMLMCV